MRNRPHGSSFFPRLDSVPEGVVPDLRGRAAVSGNPVAIDRQRDVLICVVKATADLRERDSVPQKRRCVRVPKVGLLPATATDVGRN
jgi:hypothetical protein